MAPISLRPRIHYLVQYRNLSGQPGEHRMYDTRRGKLSWPNMAKDVYTTVEDYHKCAKTRLASRVSATCNCSPRLGPWNSSQWTDILGLLSKTVKRIQINIVIIYWYTKPTWAVPSSRTTAPLVPSIFFDHWIVPYLIPAFLFTNIGTQLLSKVLKTLCTFLETPQL